MAISKYNGEGYIDPTAHMALSKVEKTESPQVNGYRPLVYICSPYSGDTEGNIERAKRYSRFAAFRKRIPITPHLLFPQFLDDSDPYERAMGLTFGRVLLKYCKEVWVFGDRISEGMENEIELARARRIPIRYFKDESEA